MNSAPMPTRLLDELEARQDDLLRRLDELDERIRRTVAELTGGNQVTCTETAQQ